MKKINLIITAFALSCLLFGCSTATIEEVEEIDGLVTYTTDVRPIISNNCLPCHAGSTPSAGLNLETFVNVRNATQNGNVLVRINSSSNPMPQGGQMAPALIATIEQWAADGYLEN